MPNRAAAGIIIAMPRPITSSRVLLVADRRVGPPESGGVALRRYRLARLRLDGRSTGPALRFEHLKRIHD